MYLIMDYEEFYGEYKKVYKNKTDDFRVTNRYYVGQVTGNRSKSELKKFIEKGELVSGAERCGNNFTADGYDLYIREMHAKFKVVELCEENLRDSLIEITEVIYTDRCIRRN